MPRRSASAVDRRAAGAIVEGYKPKEATYARFAERCELLIRQILDRRGIRVHSVTCRAKESDKLMAKLLRPDKSYKRLADVTDLAGVRIITHLEDEVDQVAEIIRKQFRVIPELSIDKGAIQDPDRFGYVSLHYVVRLAAKRAQLGKYKEYKDLLCEIQIRSILQHAWAEIEHDLGYKTAAAVPKHIRRRFSRLAALLETADEEFLRDSR